MTILAVPLLTHHQVLFLVPHLLTTEEHILLKVFAQMHPLGKQLFVILDMLEASELLMVPGLL